MGVTTESFWAFSKEYPNSVIESMNVKDLSFKNIVDLSYGFCHYIARNDENKIFCWGNNSFGQLGIGIQDDRNISMDCIHIFKNDDGIQRNEVELNEFLSVLNIAVVKCGFWHSLALTQNCELSAWGSTSNDNEEMFQLNPKKLDGFGGEKVVIIACGYNHSLALSESGRVFSWGENFYGQLGNGNEIYRENPNLIELENISIQKISCGQRHSLLLSNWSNLCFWR
jgi:E3 ubiquitin-protein ligase HERC4